MRVLALDFDGVLANHGETALLPEVKLWLDEAEEVFGANRIFILSNKPTKARSDYFTEHFTGVGFIYGVRKKPYSDGLKKAAEHSGADPSAIILIDDRLMTGGLAAILAGSRFLWITRPYIDMQKRPAREGFFKIIRSLEKAFVRIMGIGQK